MTTFDTAQRLRADKQALRYGWMPAALTAGAGLALVALNAAVAVASLYAL